MKYEKIFSFIGFIILIPIFLYAFGISTPVEFLESKMGIVGKPSVITSIAFALIALSMFFGGGDNIRATVLGFISGFLLIATSVEMNFMSWYRDWVLPIEFLQNLPLNYILGVLVVFLGMLLSYRKPHFLIELNSLIILPLVLLVSLSSMISLNPNFSLSLDQGFSSLSKMIDEKYRSNPKVVKYVEDVESAEDLSEKEKINKIKELQSKIMKLQKDQEILKKLQEENNQKGRGEIENKFWCQDSKNNEEKVNEFSEAVTPNKPCVRDFAVNLAKKESGPYYSRTRIIPSAIGIRQVCHIHLGLSQNWKYVSDPTVVRDDYYSRADRSLAIGLAGDCDDYSVVMASCVEAIGGKARIMGGRCDGGGHAWAEVLIGTQSEWENAVKIIRSFYHNRSQNITPSVDEEGNYWLPLDWRLGEYTCNDWGLEVLYL